MKEMPPWRDYRCVAASRESCQVEIKAVAGPRSDMILSVADIAGDARLHHLQTCATDGITVLSAAIMRQYAMQKGE